jgi:hypothetical protein
MGVVLVDSCSFALSALSELKIAVFEVKAYRANPA